MKKLVFLSFILWALLMLGCNNNKYEKKQDNSTEHNNSKNTPHWGYFDEELSEKATISLDTAAFRRTMDKILPASVVYDLFGSGYQCFYLYLIIDNKDQASYILRPDALVDNGVGSNPLGYQDIDYNFKKDKVFFNKREDNNKIFDVKAGKVNGVKVRSLKFYEINVFINKNKTIKNGWQIKDVGIQKYKANFVNNNSEGTLYDENMPVLDRSVFEPIRKAIKYPEEAKKNNITGRVFVKLFADENGNYAGYQLIKGLGYGCDEAVINAITSQKFKSYPTGKKSSAILPFEFGGTETKNAVDLAVLNFNYNPDKSVYCNLTLEIVNKVKLKESINTKYWIYVSVDDKIIFRNYCLNGISKSYTQQKFFFRYEPSKKGAHNYTIYLDPENKLNDSNRENNVVKGTFYVN